jgi:hypothetical protein
MHKNLNTDPVFKRLSEVLRAERVTEDFRAQRHTKNVYVTYQH